MFLTSAFAEQPAISESRRALADGVPQIAVEKLRVILSSRELSGPERVAAGLLQGEALLAAGRYEEARAAMNDAGLSAYDPATPLYARLAAAQGRWREALPLFEKSTARPEATPSDRLGLAETLHALGRTPRAIEVLEELLRTAPATQQNNTAQIRLRLASLHVEAGQITRARAALKPLTQLTAPEERWRRYVEARALLAEGRTRESFAAFEELLKQPELLGDNLVVAVTLGQADCQLTLKGTDAAQKIIEGFISRNPELARLDLAFRRLDQLAATERNPGESRLHGWSQKAPASRAALAMFYVGKMQFRHARPDKAVVTLQLFTETYPDHQFAAEASVMLAELLQNRGKHAEAIKALEFAMRHASDDAERAEIELRTGIAHLRANEPILAAQLFEAAAARSPELHSQAQFNLALAWLVQKNPEKFQQALNSLNDLSATGARPELTLEAGLIAARNRDPMAVEMLDAFLRTYPEHPRAGEARLAKAELAFIAGRNAESAALLQVANDAPHAAKLDPEHEYLAIFLAEAAKDRDDAKVIELAQAFIAGNPASPRLPEVRMKLGEVYFRGENFANAETQFAELAKAHPQSAQAEAALYFAGQSALKTFSDAAIERGLKYFDQVAERNGPLKLFARHQQALVKARQARDTEAVALYDLILDSQPELDLRCTALCGRADSLAALARKDAAQLPPALAAYDKLAAMEKVPALWRNQALYKKGKLLEAVAKPQEALVIYYDILATASKPGAEPETFWTYKSGFDAARLLEAQKEWKSAIAVYEKIAVIEGGRATEARTRVKQLRLEHFVPWE